MSYITIEKHRIAVLKAKVAFINKIERDLRHVDRYHPPEVGAQYRLKNSRVIKEMERHKLELERLHSL